MIKALFLKKWSFAAVSIVILFFQLVFSFLFPSVGSMEGSWEPITVLIPKFADQSTGILAKISPLISKYSLHNDSGFYLELGRYFSKEYYEGHPFMERPLWPFLIFVSTVFTKIFISISYPVVFGLAIFINFILTAAAAILLFLLLRDLFSLKVAWLSSILFVFSPFVHSFLNQPSAEIIMAFGVVLSVYLLNNYIKKPSYFKLALFSLIVGVMMLGKMFFAISIFILLLAVFYRRCKEGIIFLALHLLPVLLWYLWVTRVWQIDYYSFAVERYHMGIWIFNIFNLPWQTTYRVFLDAFPYFTTVLIKSFMLIPVLFSIAGFSRMPFKSKNLIYFGSIFSFFALFFLANVSAYRHAFLLFPIIYPTCILGMSRVADFLKKYRPWLPTLFYAAVIGLIIIISSINVYQIFDYNGEVNSIIILD